MSDDLILKRLIEMQERFDFLLERVDQLERLLQRYFALTKMITGASPPPPPAPAPRVN
jgi:hypothetical protein